MSPGGVGVDLAGPILVPCVPCSIFEDGTLSVGRAFPSSGRIKFSGLQVLGQQSAGQLEGRERRV